MTQDMRQHAEHTSRPGLYIFRSPDISRNFDARTSATEEAWSVAAAIEVCRRAIAWAIQSPSAPAMARRGQCENLIGTTELAIFDHAGCLRGVLRIGPAQEIIIGVRMGPPR